MKLDFVADVTRASRLFKRLFTGETTPGEVIERMPHAQPAAAPQEASGDRCARDARCLRGRAHEGPCLLTSEGA